MGWKNLRLWSKKKQQDSAPGQGPYGNTNHDGNLLTLLYSLSDGEMTVIGITGDAKSTKRFVNPQTWRVYKPKDFVIGRDFLVFGKRFEVTGYKTAQTSEYMASWHPRAIGQGDGYTSLAALTAKRVLRTRGREARGEPGGSSSSMEHWSSSGSSSSPVKEFTQEEVRGYLHDMSPEKKNSRDDIMGAVRKRTVAELEELIVTILKKLTQGDSGLRSGLSANPLESHFRLLDETQDGVLCFSDFKRMVSNFGIRVGDEDLSILMRFFDEAKKHELTYSDFAKAINRGKVVMKERDRLRAQAIRRGNSGHGSTPVYSA